MSIANEIKARKYSEPKALVKARKLVNSLEFGTEAWEEAMKTVRMLVQAETNADQALLNHRCVFNRD